MSEADNNGRKDYHFGSIEIVDDSAITDIVADDAFAYLFEPDIGAGGVESSTASQTTDASLSYLFEPGTVVSKACSAAPTVAIEDPFSYLLEPSSGVSKVHQVRAISIT